MAVVLVHNSAPKVTPETLFQKVKDPVAAVSTEVPAEFFTVAESRTGVATDIAGAVNDVDVGIRSALYSN